MCGLKKPMTKKKAGYRGTLAGTGKEIRAWLATISDKVAASALRELATQAEPPGLGVRPDQSGPLLNEWIRPMVIAAEKIGAEATRVALDGLMVGGLASTLAELSMSQRGRTNKGNVRNPAGGKPASWRVDVGKLFYSKRFMERLSSMEPGNEAQTIIDRAILDEIFTEKDGRYFDMKGKQIAASMTAMRSEISKIKGKHLKLPM